ncbi:phosphoglycerate mutase family protein [Rhodohalobacter sp. 8-1]|uniref:phosphoglycerate mutase family protein n=1 Tax=Rhodohalobacter sp. 8-1 TaxID=3131972 RepID=UPI0030EF8497
MRILLFFITLFPLLLAQSHLIAFQDNDITTFILVRHAEKTSDSRDPGLSPDGIERAELLAHMLSETDIDAVYSTNLQRTTSTIQQIADMNELEIQFYDYENPEETAASWIDQHRGDVVLISGHSNTTPEFTNALLGRPYFQKMFDESDYGNLLIVTITDSDSPQLLHLRY